MLQFAKKRFPAQHKFYTKRIKSIRQKENENNTIEYLLEQNRLIKRDQNVPLKRRLDNLVYYILPKEYPESVKANYLTYCKWSALQYTSSSICGVLATKSLLYSVGLGSASIPLAVVMNWILKDGLGQLGTILFASKISTNFDADPKKWRLVSEIVLGLSSMLEIITTLFPSYFLLMASIANVGKNISFLSSSASRVTMNKSFVNKDNLGDITGKAASQTILASTVGTAIGVILSPFLDDFTSIVIAFLFLYSLQIFSVYKAVSYVEINTFNLQKLEILLNHYFEENEILSPSQISKREKIFFKSNIKINQHLSKLKYSTEEFESITETYKNEKFLILDRFNLIYHEDANTYDVLKGVFFIVCKMRQMNEMNFEQFYQSLKESKLWNLEVEHVEIVKNRISIEFIKH